MLRAAIFGLLINLCFASVVYGATLSQTFTVDGQLFLTGTTTPLLDGTAKITVYIMDPSGTCLLYAEEQTVDTVTSNGYFNVQVGSNTGAGKRVGGVDPGRTMVQVYSNNAAIAANNVPGQTCAGGAYTPSSGDGRLVRVIVTPTSGSPDTLTPDLAMDLAPMSKVAETIQGLAPASLLQVNNSGSVALTQANLESAFTGSAWTNIQAVMAGTYGGVSSVSASAGSANLPSISFSGDANTGFYSAGANQIGVAANGAALFSIGASGMVSANTGGASVTTAAGTAAAPTFGFTGDAGLGWFRPAASTLAASTGGVERIRITSTGDLRINGSTSGYVGLRAPAVAGSATYTFPSVDGTAGQVLSTDGSGILSWTTASGGGSGFPVALGTSAAPSMNFSGDTNTGIYSPGADTVAVSTSGTERLRVDATGFVGIGTTSPAYLLDIRNNSNSNQLHLSGSGGDDGLFIMGYSNSGAFLSGGASYNGTNWIAKHTQASVIAQNNGNIDFYTDTGLTAGTSYTRSSRIRIHNTGNVGIGTTSPTARLEIAGGDLRINGSTSGYVGLRAPAVAGSGILTLPATVGTSGQTLVTDGSGVLSWATASGGGGFPVALGTSAAPSMNFSGDTDTGIYSPAADKLAVSTSGIERLRFDGSNIVMPEGHSFYFTNSSGHKAGFYQDGNFQSSWAEHLIANWSGTERARLSRDLDGASNGGVGATGNLQLFGNNGITMTTPVTGANSALSIRTGTSGMGSFYATGTEILRVTGSGFIGIGTTSPSAPLEVKSVNNGTGLKVVSNGGATMLEVGETSGNRQVTISDGSTTGMTIGPHPDGIRMNANNNSPVKIHPNADGTWTSSTFEVGSVKSLFVNPSGSVVGIGTTNPGAQLDVKDTIHISGSTSGYVGLKAPAVAGSGVLTLPATVGTSGQTLVTDGSGVLSWATASGGGGFPVALGTSAAPSMNFSGDTNTGIYSPGADMVAVSTSGAERLRISSTGFVGIGNTNPEFALHVTEPTQTTAYFNPTLLLEGLSAGTDGGPYMQFRNRFVKDIARIVGNDAGTYGGNLLFYTKLADGNGNGASTEKMRITQSGYVGIGTTAPGASLDIATGKMRVSTSSSHYTEYDNNQMYWFQSGSNAGKLTFVGPTMTVYDSTSGSDVMTFQADWYGIHTNSITSGGLQGTTYSPLTLSSNYWSLSSTTPAIEFKTFDSAGSALSVSHLQIFNGDTGKVLINPTGGNVGIGTTSPGAKLHVMEEVRIGGSTSGYVGLRAPAVAGSGILTLPATVGTSGQTLVTDGSGVLSWATASGGGGTTGIALGTSAAPSISFTADSDTGIYSPGADTVAVSTSGVERIRFSSNGRIGVGVTTPDETLHVLGSIKVGDSSNGNMVLYGTSGLARFEFPNELGWFQNSNERFKIFYNGKIAFDPGAEGAIFGGGGSQPQASAVVEIGGTTKGFLMPRMTTTQRDNIASATEGLAVYNTSTSRFNYYNGSSWQDFAVAGSSAGVLATNGSAGTPSIGFSADTGLGWFRPGTSTLAAATSGIERMRIDASGYVGIGTTAPSSLLTVKSGTNSYGLTHTDGTIALSTYLGGNNGWLGTDSNHNLAFYTNSSSARMLIDTSGRVAVGTTSPASTALLDLSSNSKGFLAPRMTTTERDAISSPATGLTIYNTTTNTINYYNGTSWISGVSFGTPSALSTGTNYLATYSGLVVAYGIRNGASCDLQGLSDSSNPPTTVRGRGYTANTANHATSITFPVKAGEYYKVNQSGCTATANFYAIEGIGASATAASPSPWLVNGSSDIYYSGTGKVGIGTTSPATTFDITSSTSQALYQIHNSTSGYTASDGLEVSLDGADSWIWNYESGSLRFGTNNTDMMLIHSGGNVGIGVTGGWSAPDSKLVVVGPTTTGRYSSSGWTHSSDARLKTDVKTIDNALEKVLQLRGVEFTLIKDEEHKTQLGFIAQETEKVFPEVVQTDKEGYKSMVYANLTAPIVEAIKSLSQEIKTLFNKSDDQVREMASLKNKTESLEKENAQLKAYICQKDPAATLCQ